MIMKRLNYLLSNLLGRNDYVDAAELGDGRADGSERGSGLHGVQRRHRQVEQRVMQHRHHRQHPLRVATAAECRLVGQDQL
jgi:hypothetical protein